MTLTEKLSADLKQAMRDRDETRKSALRLLRAAIVNEEVEQGRPLSDDEVRAVAMREARRRRESIEAFRAGGREDLVAQEEAQLQAIRDYLPQMMSREEVEEAAREVIAATGATGPKDMGPVMRELMLRLKGKAEGSLVNEVVRELLGAR
jgi:uncharacterized protein YqeY